MKKGIAIFLTALFIFSVVSFSLAEEKKMEPAAVEKPKVKQITGEVAAVDTKAMTISVKKKMKDKVVEAVATVTENTKITMDKEKKTLADVKVGDKVTLKYMEADGKKTAKSIAIKPVSTEKKVE
ncbi:MAG: hypothetical protein AB1390_08805 [Nitrospirota bacterium]